MAFRQSSTLAGAKALGAKTALDGGFLSVFEGSQPATPETAATGTKLAIISVDGDGTGLTWEVVLNALAKPSGDSWSGLGLAPGTAGYVRAHGASDDPTSTGTTTNGTDERFDMIVTKTGTRECVVSTREVIVGQAFTINSASVAEVLA